MSKAVELADWILSDAWSGHTTYVREQLFRVTQELRRLAAVEAELKAVKEAEPVAVIGRDYQLLWARQDWHEGIEVGMPLYTLEGKS